jgi:hypothetical protein
MLHSVSSTTSRYAQQWLAIACLPTTGSLPPLVSRATRRRTSVVHFTSARKRCSGSTLLDGDGSQHAHQKREHIHRPPYTLTSFFTEPPLPIRRDVSSQRPFFYGGAGCVGELRVGGAGGGNCAGTSAGAPTDAAHVIIGLTWNGGDGVAVCNHAATFRSIAPYPTTIANTAYTTSYTNTYAIPFPSFPHHLRVPALEQICTLRRRRVAETNVILVVKPTHVACDITGHNIIGELHLHLLA